eukprot:14425923-Alexandrium_andersonii.AAC.1
MQRPPPALSGGVQGAATPKKDQGCPGARQPGNAWSLGRSGRPFSEGLGLACKATAPNLID